VNRVIASGSVSSVGHWWLQPGSHRFRLESHWSL